MWSKLVGTDYKSETSVGIIAREYYEMTNLPYHNWQHILDCYQFLEDEGVEYDEALDFAVLHHDIIYDDQPDKEERSAEWLLQQYPTRHDAAEIIMATADHSIRNRDWKAKAMIKADLHQLGIPEVTIMNYSRIMRESMKLYDISVREFAVGNEEFMRKLRQTIFDNFSIDNDIKFWDPIAKGIDLNIGISREVKINLTL